MKPPSAKTSLAAAIKAARLAGPALGPVIAVDISAERLADFAASVPGADIAPGPTITNIVAKFDSPLGASRSRQAMAILSDAVEADALAASITFLLSDDGVNLNSVIRPSDGGWSAT